MAQQLACHTWHSVHTYVLQQTHDRFTIAYTLFCLSAFYVVLWRRSVKKAPWVSSSFTVEDARQRYVCNATKITKVLKTLHLQFISNRPLRTLPQHNYWMLVYSWHRFLIYNVTLSIVHCPLLLPSGFRGQYRLCCSRILVHCRVRQTMVNDSDT